MMDTEKRDLHPSWRKRPLYATYDELFSRKTDKSQLTLWFEGDIDQEFSGLVNISSEDIADAELFLKEAISLMDQIPEVASENKRSSSRPPFNAEYVLYLLLKKEEREILIGDLFESYGQIETRFNKRRADIWFYKQVACLVLPLLRRALLRIGALVWLGRMLRRLIS
ncbi:MAG TPA: hypothetical protein VN956_13495 [Pyrinomonadaceae bacterium]|nr:hypothetical protein [Pyrinomonadaceae bacterium]